MDSEIWKDVVGYEGYYQVSNLGRVKSIKRYVNHPRIGQQLINERIFKEEKLKGGYLGTNLSKNSKVKKFKIHRLVALAFIPNPDNKPFVNHINGIKTDNTLINLEWCTPKENSVHASKNGLSSTYWLGKGGEGYFGNKKVSQYNKLGELVNVFASVRIAGKALGVHPSNISRAASGKKDYCAGFVWEYE